eukprot:TRINITY_DN434_c1_g1_i2.p1 TRINITY_DN434_c1_g1~~TRINITY_DN434_c1_g1_i2.p1  ORF type:complete len:366 (-),score=89.70 TRINITY_DN434_c1_g1_i2:478-1575(-)
MKLLNKIKKAPRFNKKSDTKIFSKSKAYYTMFSKLKFHNLLDNYNQTMRFNNVITRNYATSEDATLHLDESEVETEIDPNVIFSQVWEALVKKYGEKELRFPRSITWLNGAPGSGKTTQIASIQKIKKITAPPIMMSRILNTPELKSKKNSYNQLSDELILQTLLEELLKEKYHTGCIVDGFPRTKLQALQIELLKNKMDYLRSKYLGDTTLKDGNLPRPVFHVAIFYISESTSIQRQLKRAEAAIEHNEIVRTTGRGEYLPIIETDLDPEAANRRYNTFKTNFDTITVMHQLFHFTVIDGSGSIDEVKEKMTREFRYQSSLELSETSYNIVSSIPTVTEGKIFLTSLFPSTLIFTKNIVSHEEC